MEEKILINEQEREPEIWLPISGYEGLYEISSWGRVKGLERVAYLGHGNKQMRIFPEMILATELNKSRGYLQTNLCKNGKSKTTKIHKLVATHFVTNSNPAEFIDINHIDADKENNYYKNLEWGTTLHNIQHAEKLGLVKHLKGSKHGMAVLAESDVKAIRKRYSEGGISMEDLAKQYNVYATNIYKIISLKTWKHI